MLLQNLLGESLLACQCIVKRYLHKLNRSSSQEERDEVLALPSDPLDLIKPASNEDYIGRIRKRLNEDASAREEREKRRRKVLVDQLKAHDAQEVKCENLIATFC